MIEGFQPASASDEQLESSVAQAASSARALRYWAFISYSHADERWARWLHKAIEGYRVPAALAGTALGLDGTLRPKRLFPLFRDRDELSSGASLGEKIQYALAEARNLIVICSPNAARSHWVDQEIRRFKVLGRERRVFCLIVSGEPNASDAAGKAELECFPLAVRYGVLGSGELSAERAEPLAADAQPQKDGRQDALLKLLAGILDVSFDDLKQRDQRRRLKEQAAITFILGAVILVLFLALLYALRQRSSAEREARAARAALSGQIANRAQDMLEGSPQRSVLLAARAIRITADRKEPTVPAALESLERSLATIGGSVYNAHAGPVKMVAVSPEGRWIVAVHDASKEATVTVLWDVRASPQPSKLNLGAGANTAAFSNDNRWLVVSGPEAARLFDLTSGDLLTSARSLPDAGGAAEFSTDRRWLLTGGKDQTLRLWDLANPAAARLLAPVENETSVAEWSRDGHWLATSSFNEDAHAQPTAAARLWNLGTDSASTGGELKGSRSSISHFVFDPHGSWLATSSAEHDRHTGRQDDTVRIWDLTRANASAIPRELNASAAPIHALATDREGRRLAAGGEDGVARVWDLATGQSSPQPPVIELRGHENRVIGVFMSGNNQHFVTFSGASGGLDPARNAAFARVWSETERARVFGERNAATPTSTWNAKILSHGDRELQVTSFHSSPDGSDIFVAGDSTGYILNLDEGKISQVLVGHEGTIQSVAFTTDGQSVVTGSADGTVRLWQLDHRLHVNPLTLKGAALQGKRWLISTQASGAGQALWDVQGSLPWSSTALPPGTVQFSRDETLLAEANDAGEVWLTELGDPKRTRRRLTGQAHVGKTTSLAFSRDGHRLIQRDTAGEARIWDLTRPTSEPAVFPIPDQTREVVLGVDGDRLLSYDSAEASLWQLHPSQQLLLKRAMPNSTVVVSPDARFAALRADGKTALFDLSTNGPVAPVAIPDADTQMTFSPDSRWLATYGSDEHLAFRKQSVDVNKSVTERTAAFNHAQHSQPQANLLQIRQQGAVPKRFRLPKAGRQVFFDEHGDWLLTDGSDRPQLWSLASGTGPTPPIELSGPNARLSAAAFSRDGRWLIVGEDDGVARLWDLKADQIASASQVLFRLSGEVVSVAASDDSRWFVAATFEDIELRELDEQSLRAPIRLPVAARSVWSAAFDHSGQRLLVNGGGQVQIWSLTVDELLGVACRVAGRGLTPVEWESYLPSEPRVSDCGGFRAF